MQKRIVLGARTFNLDYENRFNLLKCYWIGANIELVNWCKNNLSDWDEHRIIADITHIGPTCFEVEFSFLTYDEFS